MFPRFTVGDRVYASRGLGVSPELATVSGMKSRPKATQGVEPGVEVTFARDGERRTFWGAAAAMVEGARVA